MFGCSEANVSKALEQPLCLQSLSCCEILKPSDSSTMRAFLRSRFGEVRVVFGSEFLRPLALFARCRPVLRAIVVALLGWLLSVPGLVRGADPIPVLFLGDQGHHQPLARFKQLRPVLADKGIDLVYTQDMAQLRPKTLASYRALVVYANIDEIGREQADALLAYVQGGGGFVPLHCASYCFRNDERIVSLIGAQFQRHGGGVFRTRIAEREHPVMAGFLGFESWDETYVHHLHAEEGRTVLEFREDSEGSEPWTWVKTHGEGRVFYTAWGHDERTWGHAGFQNLVERGIRWAAGLDPELAGPYVADAPFPHTEMTELPAGEPPFEYDDVGAKIPNYTPDAQWGAQGENLRLMQRPLSPEQSMQRYVVPRGFRLELFAAEPDIGGKPICMTWDERGRLWVAETYDYPNELQPEGQGRDRIRILEDTDGDGRADRFTVFAERLSIPTSMVFSRGGVLVQDGKRTLRLTDVDGDDRADRVETLFTGWDLGDTHGGVSNFQYGLDNWIWAMQGYNQSTPESSTQRFQTFRNGFFRFRPDGSDLEFVRSTDNNTWGLGISEEGLIFGSTANRNPSVFMPVANRHYEDVRGWSPRGLGTIADTHLFKPITDRIRQVDQHGGYTAGAGHALYTARTYPAAYWNRAAFVAGPTGHLVGTFVLKPDGSGFRSSSPANLVASDDEWAAPIMAEVGPDGNVWVIDWYNYIVQHNPTPRGFETGRGNAYETDLRDKRHGRIYRVVYEEGTPSPPPDLSSLEGRLAALANPNFLWRRHAQRLLVESQDSTVIPALVSMLNEPQLDAIGLDVRAIHALWTLEGLGTISPQKPQVWQAVVRSLRHPSAGVRRNAVQVLPALAETNAAIRESGIGADAEPQVRLATLLRLSETPSDDQMGPMIVASLISEVDSRDPWIPDGATAAAARHDVGFLQSLAGVEAPTGALVRATEIVAEHFARGEDRSRMDDVLVALTEMRSPLSEAVIDGLSRGWSDREQITITDATEGSLLVAMERFPLATRGRLIKLSSRWGSTRFDEFAKRIGAELLGQVADESLDISARGQAAKELVEFLSEDESIVASLVDSISPQTDPALADFILTALRTSEVDGVGEALRTRLSSFTPAARKTAITTMMLRPRWSAALLDALEARELRLDELALDQQRSLAAHPDKQLAARAEAMMSQGGSLPSPDRKLVIEQYLEATELEGDIARGEALFRAQCSNCHMYREIGNRIGPDLTGMGLHPKEELLVHILDPNASVEGNFRVYTISTIDGLVLNGLLASETKTSVELFDSQGKQQTILREEIEEFVASPLSLMPVGFEKQLDVPQMADLLAFLTQKGKYNPVDIAKAATITSVRGMFIDEGADVERLIFEKWGVVMHKDIPFIVIDPQGGDVANTILLQGPNGPVCRRMPTSVDVPCAGVAKRIHLLSGVSGWGYPFGEAESVSMIVRLHYEDGVVEDHPLLNGVHFADYIRRVDVPGSEFAFQLRGQQLRYLAVEPKRTEPLRKLELVKGDDSSAPVVMAITVESP